MNNDDGYREVRFDIYCSKCKYQKYPENSDICEECLGQVYNFHSYKPVNYKELDSNEKAQEYFRTFSKSEEKYVKALSDVFDV